MSSNTMLKQAIIDANALREVALKNAESIVVEKYSNQIKEAVDMMLEQEEDMDLGMPDLGMPMGDEGLPSSRAAMAPEEELVSDLDSQVTYAAADGENLCPCPADKKLVTLSMKGLQDMMHALDSVKGDSGFEEEEEIDIGAEETMPAPTPGEMLPPEEEEEIGELELTEDLDENTMLELDDLLGESFFSQATQEETAEAGEEAGEGVAAAGVGIEDLAEDSGDEEGKHYKDDAEADVKRLEHLSGRHKKDLEKDISYDASRIAESLQKKNAKALKENTKLAKTNSKMLTETKQLLKEQKQLLKENKEMKNLLRKLSGKLGEVNLSNAKLIYTNQVLSHGASLNERQKQRIVEAINSADSVEAAKSIYETLQSAVGSSLKSRDKSQSLSEAIIRGNATTLRQKQKQTKQDPHMERMKKLAGI